MSARARMRTRMCRFYKFVLWDSFEELSLKVCTQLIKFCVWCAKPCLESYLKEEHDGLQNDVCCCKFVPSSEMNLSHHLHSSSNSAVAPDPVKYLVKTIQSLHPASKISSKIMPIS